MNKSQETTLPARGRGQCDQPPNLPEYYLLFSNFGEVVAFAANFTDQERLAVAIRRQTLHTWTHAAAAT
ncbi:MAG: hypothetical protein ABIT37_15900 [Luteolibacter sp.]